MRSLSLKSKIISLCCLLSFLLCVVGISGYLSLKSVAEAYDFVAQVSLSKSQLLSQMKNNSAQTGRLLFRFALQNNSRDFNEQTRLEMKKTIADVAEAETAYAKLPITTDAERDAFKKTREAWTNYLNEVDQALKLYEQAKTSKAPEDTTAFHEFMRGSVATSGRFHTDIIDELFRIQNERAGERVKEAQETNSLATILAITFVLSGTVFSLIVGFLFSRTLSNSISSVTYRIDEASSQVRAASEELSSASQTLSAGATEAASALEETVASLEELNSMVKLNADNAQQAALLSEQSSQAAEEGDGEIKRLIESMGEISASSKKIEEIINVIDDISFQTNLLALNAAVEAARAGEQGKGFAVVAEAVRALAQRSTTAAKDITSLIKDSVIKIDRGAQIASQSAVVLKSIVGSVKKVSELNAAIARASQEQSNGLAQISKAMNELDQATQRNASSSEEVASSSEEMSTQAHMMQDLVVDLTQIVSGTNQDAPPPPKDHMGPGKRQSPRRPVLIHSHKGRSQANHAARTASRYEAAIPMDGLVDVKPNIKSVDGF